MKENTQSRLANGGTEKPEIGILKFVKFRINGMDGRYCRIPIVQI